MYRRLHAKCTLFFFRFKLKLKPTDIFQWQLPYQFALKSVMWGVQVLRYGQTGRHYKVDGRILHVSCELVIFLNIFLKMRLVHCEDSLFGISPVSHWLSKNHTSGAQTVIRLLTQFVDLFFIFLFSFFRAKVYVYKEIQLLALLFCLF